jgi:hypothetical protein
MNPSGEEEDKGQDAEEIDKDTDKDKSSTANPIFLKRLQRQKKKATLLLT